MLNINELNCGDKVEFSLAGEAKFLENEENLFQGWMEIIDKHGCKIALDEDFSDTRGRREFILPKGQVIIYKRVE